MCVDKSAFFIYFFVRQAEEHTNIYTLLIFSHLISLTQTEQMFLSFFAFSSFYSFFFFQARVN